MIIGFALATESERVCSHPQLGMRCLSPEISAMFSRFHDKQALGVLCGEGVMHLEWRGVQNTPPCILPDIPPT
jgi:hypothetical protein